MFKCIAVAMMGALGAAGCAPHNQEVVLEPAGAGRQYAWGESARVFSDWIRLGDLVVRLEQTRMTTVQRRLGGVVRDSGDAAGYRTWLCYEVQDPNGPVTVVVEGSEMGSGEWVTGFKLFRPPAVDSDSGCTPLSLPMTDVVLDQRLHLGMTRTELEQRLRLPPVPGDTCRYESNVRGRGKIRIQGRPGNAWWRTRRFEVRFDGDGLTWLQSWSITEAWLSSAADSA